MFLGFVVIEAILAQSREEGFLGFLCGLSGKVYMLLFCVIILGQEHL